MATVKPGCYQRKRRTAWSGCGLGDGRSVGRFVCCAACVLSSCDISGRCVSTTHQHTLVARGGLGLARNTHRHTYTYYTHYTHTHTLAHTHTPTHTHTHNTTHTHTHTHKHRRARARTHTHAHTQHNTHTTQHTHNTHTHTHTTHARTHAHTPTGYSRGAPGVLPGYARGIPQVPLPRIRPALPWVRPRPSRAARADLTPNRQRPSSTPQVRARSVVRQSYRGQRRGMGRAV